MKTPGSQRQLPGAALSLGWCLAAALCVLNSGCATGPVMPVYVTHPPPPPEEVRTELGVVAVVGTDLRSMEFARLMGKGSSAGRGALGGFIAAPMVGGAAGGGYGFVGGLFLAPVAAAGGAIYGATAGMNQGQYEKITVALQKVVSDNNLPARLQTGCVEAIRRLAPQTLLAPTNAPASNAQTILEVTPLKFGLEAPGGINPPMTLTCVVQVRFLRAADSAELFQGHFEYFGATHTLRQWAAEDGAEFRQGITAACHGLVEQIAERVFLVYAYPGNFLESRIIPWDTAKH